MRCETKCNEVKATKLKELKNNLIQFSGKYSLIQGWIPKAFEQVKSEKVRFLHLDLDLYEPTFSSLEFFFPLIETGGIIVCDDYGFDSCPGARQAIDEFFAVAKHEVIELPTGQCFVIKN